MENLEKIRAYVYVFFGFIWLPNVSLGSLAVYESMVLSLGVGLATIIVIFSQITALMIMVNIFRVVRELMKNDDLPPTI